MKAKVVSIKELTEDNPTLCLSARRVFNECHKCPQWKKHEAGQIKMLKCNPHINPEALRLLRRKRSLLNELKKVNANLETL